MLDVKCTQSVCVALARDPHPHPSLFSKPWPQEALVSNYWCVLIISHNWLWKRKGTEVGLQCYTRPHERPAHIDPFTVQCLVSHANKVEQHVGGCDWWKRSFPHAPLWMGCPTVWFVTQSICWFCHSVWFQVEQFKITFWSELIFLIGTCCLEVFRSLCNAKIYSTSSEMRGPVLCT